MSDSEIEGQSTLTFEKVSLEELNSKFRRLRKNGTEITDINVGGLYGNQPNRVFAGKIDYETRESLIIICGIEHTNIFQYLVERIEGGLIMAADRMTAQKVLILSTDKLLRRIKHIEYEVIEIINTGGFAYIIECGDFNNIHVTYAEF